MVINKHKMESEHPRKRLRRSTRSCFQCRKRKVKCQLIDEDVDVCAECVKTGAQCSLQPTHPEESTNTGNLSTPSLSDFADQQAHGARLDRIEALLQQLVEAQKNPTKMSGSAGLDALPASNAWDDFLLQSSSYVPFTPPSESNNSHMSNPSQPFSISGSDAKSSLLALLPSAQDATTIVTSSTAWLWGPESPSGSVLKPDDTLELLDVDAIARGSPLHIAKTLLLFALYMQQLPSSFDVQFLESQSIEMAIATVVERVKLYILSHEEEACSLDGLECLTLMGLLHLNNGAIRQAWMTFRRILDVARLQRVHESYSLRARNVTSQEMALRRRLWLSSVGGDCYCSLLLGQDTSIGAAPFGPGHEDWVDPAADEDASTQRRICLIAARIAQRNAAGMFRDRDVLREIDQTLNKLQESLPAQWWKTPSFGPDRSLDSAQEPNRLVCQLWFLQAQMFAHMPVALGKPEDDMLSSLELCTEAARITLQRCLGLQHAKDHFSRCRSVEQSTFVAAVVLTLCKVQHRHHRPQAKVSRFDSDQTLLEQISDVFEGAARMCSREHVSRQVSEILGAMLRNTDGVLREDADDPGVVAHAPAGMAKPDMEEIIACSILPAIDSSSPAARLIKRSLTTASTR